MNKGFFKRFSTRLIMLYKKAIRPLLRSRANKKHVSGKGIELSCDLSVTKLDQDLTAEIKISDSIFVKSEIAEEFLVKYNKNLTGKIIIADNSDTNFVNYIPEMQFPKKIFLQNLGFPAKENISLLPIGLENYEHVRSGFSFFHRQPRKFAIKNKVLVPPMSATNPIREYVLSNVEKYPIFHNEPRYLNVFRYFCLLRKYEYVLVCEGNGFDTHRLWEVLYQGSKPVVFKSEFSENLVKMGLPVLTVENLSDVTDEVISEHRRRFENYRKELVEVLWLKHWKNKILVKTKNEN